MNIHTLQNSWLAPTLECRAAPKKGGRGIFARQPVSKGALLAMFGGTVATSDQLAEVPDELKSLTIQVEDDLFLVSTVPGDGDYFNHSCEPNAGLLGQIAVIAMRDIAADEEVTFDYATCDSESYDVFECMCETASCRRVITGDDWKNPALWVKYEGYFSPYLQAKIDAMVAESNGKVYADLRSHNI
ncbi:MAG: SET domain-containing protein [Chloroflexi bacterium]|nr:SET domain-containing protein [Chloroflexota bacterium]